MNVNRVLLLNPPIRPDQVYGFASEFGGIYAPLALCSLAAVLRESGYEVSILDAEALKLNIEETVSEIERQSPAVIGIGCKTLWIENAHKVASILKEKMPRVPIVAGGHHVTAIPERTLREFPHFDILVLGEGEITFLELIRALENGTDLKTVEGLAFMDGNTGEFCKTPNRARITDLDEMPLPAWDLLPDLKEYYNPPIFQVRKFPSFWFSASRGCNGKCVFCDRSIFGRQITRYSVDYVTELLLKMHREYGFKHYMFDDDNLLNDRDYLERFLDKLIEMEFKITFTCNSRVDAIDEEIVAQLKRAGCWQINLGIESGSQKILDAMRKKTQIPDIVNALSTIRKSGIRTLGFFIIGFPGETIETLEQTVALIKECKFDDISALYFTPLPGSTIYRKVREHGEYDEKWDLTNSVDQIVFIPNGLSREILQEYMDKCLKACYFRLGQLTKLPQRFTSTRHLNAYLKTGYQTFFGQH